MTDRRKPPEPNRKFKPQFLKELPPIPSIDKFRLNHILKHELKQESQAVVDSLLDVAHNYRGDLKNEIRFKLSIEQKIQNKNIDTAKLAESIDKQVNNAIRVLSKQLDGASTTGVSDGLNQLDKLILPIQELSGDISSDFQDLATRLNRIDKRLNGENALDRSGCTRKSSFPLLHSYYTRSQAPTPIPTEIVNERNETNEPTEIVNEPNETNEAVNETVNEANEPNETADDFTEITANETIPATTETTETKAETFVTQSSPTSPPIESNQSPELPEEFTENDFEAFMSQTLDNYRKQQQERYKTLDVFLSPDNVSMASTNAELYNNGHFDSSLSSSYHKSENPVNLLYVKPDISRSQTTKETNGKSPAIVTQNLQTSHFKKLRISGSPITSATFLKKQEQCECHNSNGHHEHNSEGTLKTSNGSPAISTETEEELSDDQVISSQSSDSDSSGSNKGITASTDGYYTSLNESYKIKHRRSRNNFKTFRDNYTREYSPTPKHEPSHRILKPKGSILKLPTNPTILPKSIIQKKTRRRSVSSSSSIRNSSRTEPGRKTESNSSTTESDPKSDPKNNLPLPRPVSSMSVDDSTAKGTIVSDRDNGHDGNDRLSILRTYVS